MICKKCGSTHISISTCCYVKSKSRSFIWNLLMICLTGGLWLIWMLVRKRKEKIIKETTYVCQECGYLWKKKK